MLFLFPIHQHDYAADETAAQRHRDTLTKQRLSREQKRQLTIDAMPKEEREEFDLAIPTLIFGGNAHKHRGWVRGTHTSLGCSCFEKCITR